MAVIIPMAKMPNNCEECDLKGLCPDYWTKIREEYTRPSWCQLDDLDATTFCGVPMEEAVEIMQMYRRGELVHLADRKTENCSEKPNNCDEPQYEMGMGTLKCDNCSEYGSFKCTKCDGEMYFTRLEPKDEPKPCEWCKFYDGENCFSQEPCKVMLYFKNEPQTDCAWK